MQHAHFFLADFRDLLDAIAMERAEGRGCSVDQFSIFARPRVRVDTSDPADLSCRKLNEKRRKIHDSQSDSPLQIVNARF